MKQDKQKALEELQTLIQSANDAYWNKNEPIMSDIEYDKLIKQIRDTEYNNALVDYIGGVKGKYKHEVPMLSLDKAYTKDEVVKWVTSVMRSPDERIVVQPKYDGLAVRVYPKGPLTTRGDGTYGEDITRAVGMVNQIYLAKMPTVELHQPLLHPNFKQTCVSSPNDEPNDGELLISNQMYNTWISSGKIRKVDGTAYSNPRNAVAGIIDRDKHNDLPLGLVAFVPYSIYGIQIKASELIENVEKYIHVIKTIIGQLFPLDGVVFKLHDREYSESLGSTAHHPRGAIAFKFDNASDIGVIDDIIWQQGKSVLTPVMLLEEPININGSNITRATCHNVEFVIKHKLRKGDKVRIERAGDVIPKVIEVVYPKDKTEEAMFIPDKCPVCGCPTEYRLPELVCVNINCKGKFAARLLHAAKTLRIDGIGPVLANMLVEKLHIKHIYQLLEHNYAHDLGHLPGYTNYSADIVYKNITNTVECVYEDEVLAACCIPGIGLGISREVLAAYSYQELLKMCTPANLIENEKLLTPVVGVNRAKWIVDAFTHPGIRPIMENMYKYFIPLPVTKLKEGYHRKVCFTGKMDVPRAELEAIANTKGDVFKSAMTKEVDLLVVASLEHNSSKVKYAKKNNIKIITCDEYLK